MDIVGILNALFAPAPQNQAQSQLNQLNAQRGGFQAQADLQPQMDPEKSALTQLAGGPGGPEAVIGARERLLGAQSPDYQVLRILLAINPENPQAAIQAFMKFKTSDEVKKFAALAALQGNLGKAGATVGAAQAGAGARVSAAEIDARKDIENRLAMMGITPDHPDYAALVAKALSAGGFKPGLKLDLNSRAAPAPGGAAGAVDPAMAQISQILQSLGMGTEAPAAPAAPSQNPITRTVGPGGVPSYSNLAPAPAPITAPRPEPVIPPPSAQASPVLPGAEVAPPAKQPEPKPLAAQSPPWGADPIWKIIVNALAQPVGTEAYLQAGQPWGQ